MSHTHHMQPAVRLISPCIGEFNRRVGVELGFIPALSVSFAATQFGVFDTADPSSHSAGYRAWPGRMKPRRWPDENPKHPVHQRTRAESFPAFSAHRVECAC